MSLSAQAVTIRRGARTVLADIGAELRQGEMLGVLGPNGAGKTTLLRAWAGLIAPDQGQVALEGKPIGQWRAADRGRQIAYLPQDGSSAWNISVGEAVALGRIPHGGADDGAVARALAAVGADGWAARGMASLSGGEAQRVLLARALAVEARYLLVDEPVASLDPRHQLAVMELLRARADAGIGVAVVMHDLTLALRFCHRLLLLDRGRLVGEGAPDMVLNDENLRAVFGIAGLRGGERDEAYLLPWRQTGQT